MYLEARFMMNPVLGRVKGRFLLTRFGGKVVQVQVSLAAYYVFTC